MSTTTITRSDGSQRTHDLGHRPRPNQPHRTSVAEDPDAKRFWQLDNHSPRVLEPGDMVIRGDELHTVVDVERFRVTGIKRVDFDIGPSWLVTDDRFDDVEVTIFRPRAGF